MAAARRSRRLRGTTVPARLRQDLATPRWPDRRGRGGRILHPPGAFAAFGRASPQRPAPIDRGRSPDLRAFAVRRLREAVQPAGARLRLAATDKRPVTATATARHASYWQAHAALRKHHSSPLPGLWGAGNGLPRPARAVGPAAVQLPPCIRPARDPFRNQDPGRTRRAVQRGPRPARPWRARRLGRPAGVADRSRARRDLRDAAATPSRRASSASGPAWSRPGGSAGARRTGSTSRCRPRCRRSAPARSSSAPRRR